MKPVIVHSDAEAEWAEAMDWYEDRKTGLGLELNNEVRAAIQKLQKAPERCSPYKTTRFRKQRVKRFPYTIFFLEFHDVIWLAAVAHNKRRPDYWIGRTREGR